MNNWVLLVILYAFFVAFIDVCKKKAVENNSIYEVLAFFSLIAFLLVSIITKDAFKINYIFLPVIFLKSSVVVIAWILSFIALKKIQISLYSMMRVSRIVFSLFLSFLFLGERINFIDLIGIFIVILGLILINKPENFGSRMKNSFILITLLLISFFLSSVSAIIDKKILLYINSGQLQFWFLLFLTFYYWIILLLKGKKICFDKLKKNYWIPIIAICLVIGDRFLFIANENVSSQVVIMTILKELSVIISIILGKMFFKETNIIKKLLYSLLIIFGIIIILVF